MTSQMTNQTLETDDRPLLNDEEIALAVQLTHHQDLAVDVILEIQGFLDVGVTGEWDEACTLALAEWQARAGLPPDGALGDVTLERIESTIAEASRPLVMHGVVSRDALRATGLRAAGAAAVDEAVEDWRGGASERDASDDGLLAKIFADSGFSPRVSYRPNGKIFDWCGMAVCAWLVRVGLAHGLRRSTFWATRNVVDFFTYSRSPVNPKRTKTKVRVGGREVLLRDHHTERGALRKWIGWQDVRATPLEALDVLPGDIVLINHHGETNGAHHITMVRSYESSVLETIEGNATGNDIHGVRQTDAVVVNRRDLAHAAQRRKIFGIGRLSGVDFDLSLEYV